MATYYMVSYSDRMAVKSVRTFKSFDEAEPIFARAEGFNKLFKTNSRKSIVNDDVIKRDAVDVNVPWLEQKLKYIERACSDVSDMVNMENVNDQSST